MAKSPYINTKLLSSAMIYPHQMNNQLYLNLKKNLSSQLENKCFSHYGYIMKINAILDYKTNTIETENMDGSAKFDISFSCRLCSPLKDTEIICKIDKINKLLITATNGPILVIITSDRINPKNFFTDNNNSFRIKSKDNPLLESGNYIKVKLDRINFYDKDNIIKVIGFLENIATTEEKELYFNDLDDVAKEPIIEYDKYNT